jgi:CheY-like chemotaxis protein
MAMKKQLKVEFFRDDRLETIYADKTRFKQILFNLISNAIKFTPKDGSVSVHASQNGDMAVFVVRDTGIGISEEDISKLFQPFTQLDSAINRQYEGTGLGLSLVKKFVEIQNGRIWVESKPGEGTTFTFELPLIKSMNYEAIPEETHKVDGVDGRPVPGTDNSAVAIGAEPLILVVEDDDNSRELIEATLEKEGYRVASACCGKEALLLAEKLKPFAITLDLMMPGMDGWDVLKHLKDEEQTKDIPVIITSMLDEKEMGKMWGTVDYFIKPVPKEALIATLERIRKDASYHADRENCKGNS